jgi:hypothetical protein
LKIILVSIKVRMGPENLARQIMGLTVKQRKQIKKKAR